MLKKPNTSGAASIVAVVMKVVAVMIMTITTVHAQQTWQPTRNSSGNITANFLGTTEEFIFERSNQEVLTGFAVGHGLPRVENHLFYNLSLDGYGGLPFGSCLQRGSLIPNNNPTKELCTANENRDLMRVWDNRNPNLKNVVLKNMTIKNAFRTFNVVDGTVVKTSRDLPHTDTFQTFYSGRSQENPEWLVIQDTDIRNSDNNLMIAGGSRFAGVLYHNLATGCDQAFLDDADARIINDHVRFSNNSNPRLIRCNNAMSINTTGESLVWLVEVSPGGGGARVGINNGSDRVIVVGHRDFPIQTRLPNRQRVDHPNVHYYPTIEAALAGEAAAGETRRPPLLELSCAGWQTPPDNCESRRGFIGGGTPRDTSDAPDSPSNGNGGTGTPDGSDRPADDEDAPNNPPPTASATNALPVSHWRLDERNGTTANNSAGGAQGQFSGLSSNQWSSIARVGNSSLRFDGGDERLSLGNLDASGSQITLTGWIRPSDVAANSGEGRIISKASGTAAQAHYWMLSTDENGSGAIVPRVRLKTGNNTLTLLGDNSSEVSNNQWAHIVATYNGNELRLYYNGRSVGSLPQQGSIARNPSVPAAIGNQPQGGRGFEGLIDDVCIYNVAIAPQEVRRLYNGGNGLACDQLRTSVSPAPAPPSPTNPRATGPMIAPVLLLLDDD